LALGATRNARHHARMTSPLHATRTRNKKILLSGGTGVAQRLLQLLTGLITLPLVLHALGVAGFGIWGAATSLSWVAGMLDLGLGGALVTLLPRAQSAGDDLRPYVTASLLTGAAFGALLLLGGGALAWFDRQALPSLPFLIASTFLAVNIPLGLTGSIWFGLQKGHVSGLWDLAQTALLLTLLLLSAWAGLGVAAMVASIYAAQFLANAGSLTHLLWRYPQTRLRPSDLSSTVFREVLRSGLLLSALSIIFSCSCMFDNVLALHWLGPAAAAQMTVAMRLCITATGLLTVATQALWPAFVEAVAADDHAWVLQTLLRGTLAVGLLAVGGSAIIISVGAPVLRWWLHEDLHLSALLFWAMAGWITLLSLPRVAGLLLNAVAIFRGQLLVQSLTTTLALGLKFFLAERFGVAGILAATPLVCLVLVCPAYAWLAARWIGGTGVQARKHFFF
jgi:O-antigen/teichoic acid export membrane protein